MVEGTWSKSAKSSLVKFVDQGGKEYILNQGSSWVHVIDKEKLVEYSEDMRKKQEASQEETNQ